jgi:hypothetical protein
MTLLDFSKLESNKLSIDIHPFDPVEEFEKEVEVFTEHGPSATMSIS